MTGKPGDEIGAQAGRASRETLRTVCSMCVEYRGAWWQEHKDGPEEATDGLR